MDITLYYFEDCPNWRAADERLQVLADERGHLTITHRLVESPQEAERVNSVTRSASSSMASTGGLPFR